MARSIRIQYPGAFYHIMARGNRRERIFFDDEDSRSFLATLGRACERTGWQVYAWVLMGNHYHLLVETPEPNLVAGMQWLQNTVTRRFNLRHRKWGRVFGDRYKAILVEGTQSYYLETLLDYIHLNPVRARLIQPGRGESVLDYPWSSVAGAYGISPRQRPRWAAASAALAMLGLPDTSTGRRKFVSHLDDRAENEARSAGVPLPDEEADARRSHLRRGWYWGTQAFADRMFALGESVLRKSKARSYRGAAMRKAHDLASAERMLGEGLAALGLDEKELTLLKGSDPRKVALARLLWEKTTVSQSWLAAALKMGGPANVSQQLRRITAIPPKITATLRAISVKN